MSSSKRGVVVVCLVLASTGGCSSADVGPDATEALERGIVGGTPAIGYPEAVYIDGTDGAQLGCSGALIAPRLVLTAGHCVGSYFNAPGTYQVTAPFAPGTPTVTATRYTHYGQMYQAYVLPDDPDVAILQLDEPIELAAYPSVDAGELTEGSLVRALGRVHEGVVTDSAWVSAALPVEDGAALGFPLVYAITPSWLESGDSGGPVVVDGSSPHRIVAVNSATAAGYAQMARVDLHDVAGWIDSLVERCGTADCRMPVTGFVDRGEASSPPCPAGSAWSEAFLGGLDYCCPQPFQGQCTTKSSCPAGTTYAPVQRAIDHCVTRVVVDGSSAPLECPTGTTQQPGITFRFLGSSGAAQPSFTAVDTCAGAQFESVYSATTCGGILVSNLGVDACMSCEPGFTFDGTRCAPRPLALSDVIWTSRNASVSRTEYFMSTTSGADYGHFVHLIGASGSQYTYAGAAHDGYLLVGHTFGTVASAPYSVDITYTNQDGSLGWATAYFPAFSTTTKKMFFWVAQDGTTFYADLEHDGVSITGAELLSPEEAMRPEHKAADRASVESTSCGPGLVIHQGACMAAMTVHSATFGASCGRSEGNVTREVAARCDGGVYCSFVVPAPTGEPCHDGDFSVEWSCGDGPPGLSATIDANAVGEVVYLYCD